MRRLVRTCVLILFVGCASSSINRIEMNVQAFADPEVPIPAGSSFATVELHVTKNELLEKELLAMLRTRLEAKGLRYVDKAPDFLVGITGFMGSYDHYIPPTTLYFPVPGSTTQTTSVIGNAGGVPFNGVASSTTTGTGYLPVTLPGRTRTQYVRIIDIIVAQPSERDGKAVVKSVWSGKVESTGATGDLLLVAPPLIDELLTEFPKRTGRNPRRVVAWHPPAG